jgi:hypothetical protein
MEVFNVYSIYGNRSFMYIIKTVSKLAMVLFPLPDCPTSATV